MSGWWFVRSQKSFQGNTFFIRPSKAYLLSTLHNLQVWCIPIESLKKTKHYAKAPHCNIYAFSRLAEATLAWGITQCCSNLDPASSVSSPLQATHLFTFQLEPHLQILLILLLIPCFNGSDKSFWNDISGASQQSWSGTSTQAFAAKSQRRHASTSWRWVINLQYYCSDERARRLQEFAVQFGPNGECLQLVVAWSLCWTE